MKLKTSTARLEGKLGTLIECEDHGVVAWVRTSMIGDVIGAHVRRRHTVTLGGPNDRTVELTR